MTEWISVKDRLPKIDCSIEVSNCVLMCYKVRNDPSCMTYRRVGHYMEIEGIKSWGLAECLAWDYLPMDADDLIEVTHWMPIPEPPK